MYKYNTQDNLIYVRPTTFFMAPLNQLNTILNTKTILLLFKQLNQTEM